MIKIHKGEDMIEQYVLDTFEKTQYDMSQIPIRVVEIANRLGFTVGNAVIDDAYDGFIVIGDGVRQKFGVDSNKVIGVNSKKSHHAKRFAIAHELGHYICNKSYYKDNQIYGHRENRKGKNKEENDMDYFAACLLMPKEFFSRDLTLYREKQYDETDILILLSQKYDVSKDAVKRRIGEVEQDARFI